jgi:hypothetical protein
MCIKLVTTVDLHHDAWSDKNIKIFINVVFIHVVPKYLNFAMLSGDLLDLPKL